MNTASRKKSGHINESHLSADTRSLIKGMIKQSKLNETQCLIMDQLIKNGNSLPPNPSSNSAPLKNEILKQTRAPARIPIQKRPRIRMRESMIKSGAYELEPYRPMPNKDRALEKTKLQNLMSGEEEFVRKVQDPLTDDGNSSDNDEEELDERKMLIQEIKERRAWLNEMNALNKGDKFKNQIEAEIAIRLNQMKLLSSEK